MRPFYLALALCALLIPSEALGASKFSDLPVEPSIGGSEVVACVDGGVSRKCTMSAIKTFVGATGVGLSHDITAAPYNAVCNGTADDSDAFEQAADDGGAFLVPPYATCKLSSTLNHVINGGVLFYGLEGARDFTSIDIDSGNNFLLQAGASVGIYNLTIKDGDDFLFIDGTLTGTIGRIECVGNIWDNVNTWCISWNQINEDAGAKINRILAHHNVVVASVGSRGFNLLGGEVRDVNIHHNDITGGEQGIKVGFVADSDAVAEVTQRERIIISNNEIKDIDGNGSTTTTHCINVHGRYAIITNNICTNIFNAASPSDTECIYSKSRYVNISGNTLFNCGKDEGAIVWKGGNTADPESCTLGSCSRRSIIANNIIVNEDFTIGGDYNCILALGSEVSILGNQLTGCTDKAIKVAGRGDNILIANNSIMNFAGGTSPMIVVHRISDNVQIIGNMFFLYNDSEVTSINVIDIQLDDTWTNNAFAIRNNQFFVPDITEGDTIRGIIIRGPTSGSAILNDLDISDNWFEPDMDVCIRIQSNLTINRLTINGNSMRCTDPYDEASAPTVNGCEQSHNRGWNTAEGDSCVAHTLP